MKIFIKNFQVVYLAIVPPDGWMGVFLSWIEHWFQASMEEQKVQKPLILFIDGARSHISIKTAKYCQANIILYTLFPNTTHLIQPSYIYLIFMNVVKNNY